MKFIHAADIHLDSPLIGLASYQNAPVQALRTASRDAFTRLIDVAIDEAVDFMVIAGDLYDGNWRDFNTGHFFVREMGRLHKAGIPVFLLYGNHDAESEMTRRLTLPANVHVFDTKKPVTHKLEALRVALHGRSFKDAATFCSTSTAVIACDLQTSRTCWNIRSTRLGARPMEGSSSSRQRGLPRIASDIASICCCPPLRLPARIPGRSASTGNSL